MSFEDLADMTELEEYWQREWRKFVGEPKRFEDLAFLAASRNATRVLDVGCGAGQELIPFVKQDVLLVGIDLAPEAGRLGQLLFSTALPPVKKLELAAPPVFVRGSAERLPLASAVFDVVICRLVLPYTDNRRALAEMNRVLAPGGILILKFHHLLYYIDEALAAFRARRWRRIVRALRVIAAGLIYHLIGRQWRAFISNQTFQTRWLLDRELSKLDHHLAEELADSTSTAPSFLITKAESKTACADTRCGVSPSTRGTTARA